MKQYRGYYIDGITFNSKADIDRFVKDQSIKDYKKACRYFAQHPTMEASVYCNSKAEFLHKEFGMSWDEIEEIEISAYAA